MSDAGSAVSLRCGHPANPHLRSEIWAPEVVDVLGHEDIAEDVKLVPLSGAFEGVEEDGAGVVVVEVGETVIATKCDEVVVAEGVVTLEVARHVGMIPDG